MKRLSVLVITLLLGLTAPSLAWAGRQPYASSGEANFALGDVTVVAETSASTSPNVSSANYAIDWSVAGEVSGGSGASASYQLDATIGRMAAGANSASANYGLCTGYECLVDAIVNLMHKVFLPFIKK